MISAEQFGKQSITINKQAMPEDVKFDGPASLEIAAQNSMVPHSRTPLPKPGFSS